MAGNTEIVPILSAGVSFNRFLRPYFISSAILVAATILVFNFVLPQSNKARLDFEETYYRDPSSNRNVFMQLNDNDILHFSSYHGLKKEISNFSLENYENDQLAYTFKARTAKGDSTNTDWHFESVQIRHMGDFNDNYRYYVELDTTMEFGISDLVFRPNKIDAMNNKELDEFIEEQERTGSEKIAFYRVKKHERWASPFAIFILTLIGVSVSSKKSRGGLGINIAIGLGICVLYIFAMQMTTVAAINVGFTPLWAVWLPNIIFSFIAYYLYLKAPK